MIIRNDRIIKDLVILIYFGVIYVVKVKEVDVGFGK